VSPAEPTVPVAVHVPVHPRVLGSGTARGAAPGHDPTAPVRLALVANGKPNSSELLDALADELRTRVPSLEVRSWRKGSVSIPPDPTDFREIVGWATAVLCALGD
jgi:hypothetical protein